MIRFINKICVTFLLAGSSIYANAQLIDNTFTFSNIQSRHYFRFHYDNDFFTASDQYYSQGIMFEYAAPSVKKFFLSKLLPAPYKILGTYGISFNLAGYTPTSISSDAILYGDRPYSSTMFLKVFNIMPDSIQQQQLSSSLSIGVIGPSAQGEAIQVNIHRWLGNIQPRGWQYQVQNDLLLNYQLTYEKQLLSEDPNFLLNTTGHVSAGTFSNKLSGGFNFMAGHFNKRFLPVSPVKQRTEVYFFAQGKTNLVGYDASLQGGMFNRKNPYTIAASDITRLTFQADAGVVVNFKKLSLAYTQSYLTKEFRTGNYHRWGGFRIGVAL